MKPFLILHQSLKPYHHHIGSFLILSITSAILLFRFLSDPGSLIWPSSGLGSDIVIQAWPDMKLFGESMELGYLPLWDEGMALGSPMPGKVGAMWLYPLTIIFLFLPTTYAFSWMAWLHLLLLGIFTNLFFLELFPGKYWGALISSIIFMLNPKIIGHLAGGHHNLVAGLVWMPLVLLFFIKALRTTEMRFAVLTGVAIVMQIPNHPQITLGTGYLLAVFAGWKLVTASLNQGSKEKVIGQFVILVKIFLGVFSVALILSTIWWLPTLELLPHLVSIEFSEFRQFWYQLPPGMLLTVFFPPDFNFPEWMMYFGIGTIIFSLVAVRNRENRKYSLMILTCALIGGLIALGDFTPLHEVLNKLLLGYPYFRVTTRFWFFSVFGLAILAGIGLETHLKDIKDDTARREHPLSWGKLLSILYIFGGGLSLLILWINLPDAPKFFSVSWITGTLIILLISAGRGLPVSRNSQAVALILLLLIDLSFIAFNSFAIQTDEELLRPRSGLNRYLPMGFDERILVLGASPTYLEARMRGIETLNGILNIQLKYSTEEINDSIGCQSIGYTNQIPKCIIDNPAAAKQLDLVRLGRLNVGRIITSLRIDGTDLILLATVQSDEGDVLYIYDNPFVLDRVYLIQAQDETNNLFLNTQLTGVIEPYRSASDDHNNQINISDQLPGKITLDVMSEDNAFLVYSEAWAPAWKAFLNGVEVEVGEFHGVLRIPVQAGQSRLELIYQPTSWIIAWPASIVSCMMIGAWLLKKQADKK